MLYTITAKLYRSVHCPPSRGVHPVSMPTNAYNSMGSTMRAPCSAADACACVRLCPCVSVVQESLGPLHTALYVKLLRHRPLFGSSCRPFEQWPRVQCCVFLLLACTHCEIKFIHSACKVLIPRRTQSSCFLHCLVYSFLVDERVFCNRHHHLCIIG